MVQPRHFVRVFLFVLFALAVCFRVEATVNINAQLLSKSVVFLYRGDTEGHPDPTLPLGTGFLVRIPLLSKPTTYYMALVTARHVVDTAWMHCPDSQPQVIYARLNKRVYDPQKDDSGVEYSAIPLSANGAPTWSHPDEDDLDVAVILLNAKNLVEKYDAEAISISDFATEDEAKLRVATDQVISVGLLLSYPGVKRNYPVLKFGRISTKPDEPVPAQCVKDGATRFMRLWLLSINLIPGNSGSPIFYATEGANGVSFGGGRTSLIGLQSTSFMGADISGMTPVEYIFEAIQGLKLPDADLYRGVPRSVK